MKTFNRLFLAIFAIISVTTFTSCEDDDKRFPPLTHGGFVKFVELPEFKIGDEPSSANFNAITENPNNTVESYSVSVRGYFNGATEDTIAFRSTNSFPFDVGFTGSDMALLFNVNESVFETGDRFEFFGVATTHEGIVYDGTQTGCECPQDPLDPENPDATTGTWNGGQTSDVLLDASSLLQAYAWGVRFVNP